MKGQYFSFDAIIASVIFALAVFTLFSYWHSIRSFLDFQSADLTKKAVEIAVNLFLPSSSPCEGGVLGFGERGTKVLDWEKVRACSSLDQERIAQNFRSSAKTNGDVCLRFVRADLSAPISLGACNFEGAREVARIRRAATFKEGAERYFGYVDVFVYR